MMKQGKKKPPVDADGRGKKGDLLNGLHPQYTAPGRQCQDGIFTILNQSDLNNLIDLAQHEADTARAEWLRAARLENDRRRAYFRAVANLAHYQRMIPQEARR